MNKNVLEFEQNKLLEAQKIIFEEILKLDNRIDDSNLEIKDISAYIKEQGLDELELIQSYSSINHLEDNIGEHKKEIDYLKKIINKPFFARLDVFDEDLNIYYIGLKNILKDYKPFILDWRAPLASLLYYSDLGKTSYIAPRGNVELELRLKRQFTIKNAKILSYVDSGLKINDEMLLDVLANNTSSYMKNIVETIQKEQNEIIRRNTDKNVIINGVAGSGKTSISLHRLAYILYAKKEKITSKNIQMISPNNMFNEYVSEILPELGEENVFSSTMDSLLRFHLLFPDKINDKNEMLENQFDLVRQKSINIKHSLKFFKLYNDFLSNFDIKPIIKLLKWNYGISDELLSKSDFYDGDKTNIFERLKSCIAYIINNKNLVLTDKAFEKELNKKLKESMKIINANKLIQIFYKKNNLPFTALNYEDLYIFSYTQMKISDYKKDYSIKYLYVDEIQDYDPFALSIIKSIFCDAKVILCGDYRQNILSSQSNLEFLKHLYPDIEIDNLTKCYRSTTQIVKFSQAIIKENNATSFVRNGEKPLVKKCSDNNSQYEFINSFLKKHPTDKIAVLVKTDKDAKELSTFCPDFDLIINDNDSKLIRSNKIITTIYLSKGLEYDHIIIPFVDENTYFTQLDKQNLYVASTRALHNLICLFSNNISKFVPVEFSNYLDENLDKTM